MTILLALCLLGAQIDQANTDNGFTHDQLIGACQRAMSSDALQAERHACLDPISDTLASLHPKGADTRARSCLGVTQQSRQQIIDALTRKIQTSQLQSQNSGEDAAIFITRLILEMYPCGIRSYW